MIDAPLDAIPERMAAAVRPALDAATLDGYRRFLDAMAHYTRRSGERLRHAADRTPPGPVRDLFASLAQDEAGHYRLAEADLATFGMRPSEHEPSLVTGFHSTWMNATDPGHWLGALYALEQVGSHLQRDAARNLARLGLRRDQARFVLVHLDVDPDHGARAAAACSSWPDAATLVDAARGAGEFWVRLHLEAFEG